MPKSAIHVSHVTKRYKLYPEPIDRLKEALTGRSYHEEFYALDDVTFTIPKGQTVGIIGRNGAGKSTLLKIITGVLTPSSGRVHVNGTIASLLELGAGFNPQLSGIENIYFNATMMGLSRESIDARLEQITAFADIGSHIHAPVKTYSSGMFARLAFAVSIHVDPDILIIDEALSVGDIAFQLKCFQKFRDFQNAGKTILFVSHSTQQIIQYCDKAILIHDGRLVTYSDDVKQTTFEYEQLIRAYKTPTKSATAATSAAAIAEDFDTTPNTALGEHRFGSHEAILRHVVLSTERYATQTQTLFNAGERVHLRFFILAQRAFESVVIGTSLKNKNGMLLWGDNTVDSLITLKAGMNIFTMSFALNLVAGEYFLHCGLADISVTPRIELDQRWPLQRVSVVSTHRTTQGVAYAPADITIGS
ncbi:MAG: ABC transporter ATP-binding protein [Campylobacterales bacterium]|nr:ABC transporter ATP-binding protein [Campylobacterales bacterium]